MLITYDTEFLDDGRTIDLFSIGMVAENGDELYRIVGNADWTRLLDKDWMIDNVVKHLPIHAITPTGVRWDTDHPDYGNVLGKFEIARDVSDFLVTHGGPDDVQLWADYPATDHVALYQLFGPMIECTKHGMPMRTSCLTQEEVSLRLNNDGPVWWDTYRAPFKPEQPEHEKHNAMWDAQHDMALARWLELVG